MLVRLREVLKVLCAGNKRLKGFFVAGELSLKVQIGALYGGECNLRGSADIREGFSQDGREATSAIVIACRIFTSLRRNSMY